MGDVELAPRCPGPWWAFPHRSRQAIQPGHDPRHHRVGVRREQKVGVDQLRPVGEQAHSIRRLPGCPRALRGQWASRSRASPTTPIGSRLVARIRTSSSLPASN
jgi:hypothetical protein